VIAGRIVLLVNTGATMHRTLANEGHDVAAGALKGDTTMCGSGLTPATTLIEHHGLETKARAEVQDLYSRPIRTTPVLPLVTGEHRVPRVPTADAA
jgi:hypothetical protein